MATIHEAEMATYERCRAELLRESHGKWVLVKEDAIHGVFETEEEALGAGYYRFGGAVVFLVRRIERPEEEKVHYLPWIVSSHP